MLLATKKLHGGPLAPCGSSGACTAPFVVYTVALRVVELFGREGLTRSPGRFTERGQRRGGTGAPSTKGCTCFPVPLVRQHFVGGRASRASSRAARVLCAVPRSASRTTSSTRMSRSWLAAFNGFPLAQQWTLRRDTPNSSASCSQVRPEIRRSSETAARVASASISIRVVTETLKGHSIPRSPVVGSWFRGPRFLKRKSPEDEAGLGALTSASCCARRFCAVEDDLRNYV